MNEPTPLQRAADEAQWHNRKTGREHPSGPFDPDNARDMDADKTRDNRPLFLVTYLRGGKALTEVVRARSQREASEWFRKEFPQVGFLSCLPI